MSSVSAAEARLMKRVRAVRRGPRFLRYLVLAALIVLHLHHLCPGASVLRGYPEPIRPFRRAHLAGIVNAPALPGAASRAAAGDAASRARFRPGPATDK